MEPLIEDLGGKVTIGDLTALFGPLSHLAEILDEGIRLFLNPDHQIPCLKILCEHRRHIESLDISKEGALEELNKLLDSEESWVLWQRWWTGYYYNCEAWSLYYSIWRFHKIGSTIYPIRKAAFKYAKMHRDYDKKFSFKFGDYLYHMAKETKVENWKNTVEECFMIGFNKANKMALKRAKKIGIRLVVDFIYEAIAGKIENMIIMGMKDIISPLEIPDPINQLLDLNSIVTETVQKSLNSAIEELVIECIITPFSNQLTQ